eukprot:CAMPEP_0206404244 /NCGR_PEP_ID=MMETSP0294-20121207/28241_1 /ASSEMBLY_ACC=CAM_ASM_000327 /TAXON_ID=39354 /ORGANISM="Heterosigma akashiwo, Strain CCMP2393" /LENGTH=149 /DNA_ID=CAMNT_0053862081 /DNA_START=4 /DNA_END=449 /DNA_ORIENTATION=-
MNLCLTSEGKSQAEQMAPEIIEVLDALLDSSNTQEVRHYAQGALYGLLGRGPARRAARAAGLEEKLQAMASGEIPGGQELRRQARHLLRLLSRGLSQETEEQEAAQAEAEQQEEEARPDDDDVEEDEGAGGAAPPADELPEDGRVVAHG